MWALWTGGQESLGRGAAPAYFSWLLLYRDANTLWPDHQLLLESGILDFFFFFFSLLISKHRLYFFISIWDKGIYRTGVLWAISLQSINSFHTKVIELSEPVTSLETTLWGILNSFPSPFWTWSFNHLLSLFYLDWYPALICHLAQIHWGLLHRGSVSFQKGIHIV